MRARSSRLKAGSLFLLACCWGLPAIAGDAPTPAPSVNPSPSPSPSAAPLSLEEPAAGLPDLSLEKSDGMELTLEDSVQLAIRSATLALKARNAVEISGAVLLQSYGQFLPNLTSQVDYAYDRGNQYLTTGAPTFVSGSSSNAGFTVATDLNIFNGLSDYSHLKSSLLRKDASELSLYRVKQAIALDVTQSFLSVVLDDQLVAIALKNLQESQAREKLLQEQTRVGAKNLADLFRQEAQTSSDESLLLTSENKKRADQVFLLQKLRVDVSKGYHFIDTQLSAGKQDERYGDEAGLLQSGLANRADLTASDKTADAAHWDVKTQWGNYLPKLDLFGNATSGGHYLYSQEVAGLNVVPPSQSGAFSQLGSQIEYQVGLSLSWTLFDRFLTHQEVVKARARADDAEIDAEDTRNQIRADVRLAYGNYKTALQLLLSSRKGLEAAQKAYEVIEGRYEVGSANFIDLITVQATLLQAESSRAEALIDFALQEKSVEFAIGTIQVD